MDCTFKGIRTVYRFDTDRFLKSFKTLWIDMKLSALHHQMDHQGKGSVALVTKIQAEIQALEPKDK